jgi:prolyl oligopeptidase
MNRSVEHVDTPRRPVHQDIGGISFEDAYVWLEDDAALEVQTWQQAQNDVTTQSLRSLSQFGDSRKLLTELQAGASSPRPVGGRWFRDASKPGADHAMLMVSDEPFGDGTVLVDPNLLAAERGIPVSLNWWFPSPDGRYVACGLSENDADVCALTVVDATTGEQLDRVDGALNLHLLEIAGAVGWLPDGSGLFFTGLARDGNPWSQLWFHRLSAPPPSAPEDVAIEGQWPMVGVSADGRWAFVILANPGPVDLKPEYVCDLTADERVWQPFLRDLPHLVLGHFVGDDYVAVSYDRPKGRVVSIPIATAGDASTWRELLGEGDAAINGIGLCTSGLVVSELVNSYPRVRFFSLDGSLLGELPVSGPGGIGAGSWGGMHKMVMPGDPMVRSNPDSDEIVYIRSTPSESPAVFRYVLGAEAPVALTEPAHRLPLQVHQVMLRSTDGAVVPIDIVTRSDSDTTGPRPTLLVAYGNAGVSLFPSYDAEAAVWALSGGAYVLAHIRGGGDLGNGWRQAGSQRDKQHSFDDVHVVAEHLVADGVTTREQLVLMGGSAGGLLVTACLTQRPELYGAVVAKVPACDLMRGIKDMALNYAFRVELGDPNIPEQAQTLYAYSPYHNVKDGDAYPATLIVAGAHDLRALPYHARKMAASLQHATSSAEPILLYVEERAGHGLTASADVRLDMAATELAFMMQATSLSPSA